MMQQDGVFCQTFIDLTELMLPHCSSCHEFEWSLPFIELSFKILVLGRVQYHALLDDYHFRIFRTVKNCEEQQQHLSAFHPH